MTVVNLSPKGLVPAQHLLQLGPGRLGLAFLCSLAEIRHASLPGLQASGQRRAGASPTASVPLLRLNVSIECKRVSGLEPATVDWAFDLTKTNMQTM